MQIKFKNISFSNRINEQKNDWKLEKQKTFEIFLEKIKKSNLKVYLSKTEKIEWSIYKDRFTNEDRKIGLKFVELNTKINNFYILAKININWTLRESGAEIFFWTFNIFDRKIDNGTLVIFEKTDEQEFNDFYESLLELSKKPNFIQHFEDSTNILKAINLYEKIVNKQEQSGAISIPFSKFKKNEVYEVDKKLVPQNINLINATRKNFVNYLNINSLGSDSYKRKIIQSLETNFDSSKKDIKKTLNIILKNKGELSFSENNDLSINTNFVKLIDYKIIALNKNQKKLILFIENNKILKDQHYIHIFDRLSKIKSKTMFSVVNKIKKNQLSNNNLFQFLFNNGNIKYIENLDENDWEINEEIKNKYSKTLNEKQKKAFDISIDNYPIAFIQGPPGTGKTYLITQICKYYNSLGKNILLTSQTNVAVENIMENLINDNDYKDICIKADFNKSKYSIEQIQPLIEKKIFNILNLSDDLDLSYINMIEELANSKIIGTTTTSSAIQNRIFNNFNNEIDVLIVDEISKSSVPELIRYVVQSKKIIFVGDQRQLSPLDEFDEDVWEEYLEKDKNIIKNYISISIFDKLYKKMEENKRAIMLTENRRSIKAITDVYSLFYDDKLDSMRKNKDSKIKWKDSKMYPFSFIAMNGSQEIKIRGGSRFNIHEAEYIQTLLEELSKKIINANELSVAVISMYGAQIKQIIDRVEINKFANNFFKKIKINTVDAFQGDQADIVILSTIRADKSLSTGFINDYRRVNVAISRARDLAIVLGNDTILKNVLMQYDQKSKTFFNDIFKRIKNDWQEKWQKIYEEPIKRKTVN